MSTTPINHTDDTLVKTLSNLVLKAIETKEDKFYDEAWFTSLLAMLVSFAILFIDHRIQSKKRKEEEKNNKQDLIDNKEKEITDLKAYFFKMAGVLILAVEEQIESYKDTIKQIDERPYKKKVRKVVPSLNLEKIYYLTPKEMFQIFVVESNHSSDKKAQDLIGILQAFDSITSIKKSSEEVDITTTPIALACMKEFTSALQELETARIKFVEFCGNNSNNVHVRFCEATFDLSYKLSEDSKGTIEMTEEERANINITEFRLQYIKDIKGILNNQVYRNFPNKAEWQNIINKAEIAILEYNTVLKDIKDYYENFIQALGRANVTLKNNLKEIVK